MRTALRSCLVPLLLTAVSSATLLAGTNTVNYTISHKAQKGEELPPVTLEHGDTLDVEVTDTNNDCYFYNARIEVDENHKSFERGGKPAPKDVQHLFLTHDESVIAYHIEITPRDIDPCKPADITLGARSYTIPVRALWNLVGAGGFVGHDLINPEFYLQPKEGTTGFIVRRQAANEDDMVVSSVAMIHLYRAGRGWKGVSLAPLTFGLSVDQNRNDYLVGISPRFGNRVYVTFGRIFGNVNRLPNGLAIDSPTDNANALTSLPTQRKGAWFVGASFGFLSAGVSNLFKTKVGIPQVRDGVPAGTASGGTGAAGSSAGASAAAIKVEPSSGPAGATTVKLTPPDGVAFGTPAAGSRVEFTDSKAQLTEFPSRNMPAASWTATAVSLQIPSGAKPGDAKLEVFVADKKIGTANFNVIPIIKVAPETGRGKDTVSLKQVPDMDFGKGEGESTIVLVQDTTIRTLTPKTAGVTWKPEEIIFAPGPFSAGDVKISVVVNGKTKAISTFKVVE